MTAPGRFVVLLAVLFARAAGARADSAPEGTAAAAKPAEERGIKKVISRAELPGGLVLEVEPGGIAVRRGALAAPLPVLGRSVSPRALKGVVMEDDGGRSGAAGLRGRLIVTIEDSCDQKHEVSLTLADLNARIENVAALALYRQRKWADAADGFARALALDPGLDVAVTNLASAQVRGGKPTPPRARWRRCWRRRPSRPTRASCRIRTLRPCCGRRRWRPCARRRAERRAWR